MLKTLDIGIRSDLSFDEMLVEVQRALGVQLEERENDNYAGGRYFYAGDPRSASGEDIICSENFVDDGDVDPVEPTLEVGAVILELARTTRDIGALLHALQDSGALSAVVLREYAT